MIVFGYVLEGNKCLKCSSFDHSASDKIQKTSFKIPIQSHTNFSLVRSISFILPYLWLHFSCFHFFS